MSHLLHVTRLQAKAIHQRGNIPLMLEFGVSEETAPYLVSSSSSVMWVQRAHPGPSVKVAIREVALSDFFREVIDAIALKGSLMQWGNVQPLTLVGLQAAIDHVGFYGLGPLELLIPRTHESKDKNVSDLADIMPPTLRPFLEDIGVPFRLSSWVPKGTIVVVPKDRQYVGVVSRVSSKKLGGVVHNASRGVAVVRGT